MSEPFTDAPAQLVASAHWHPSLLAASSGCGAPTSPKSVLASGCARMEEVVAGALPALQRRSLAIHGVLRADCSARIENSEIVTRPFAG